MPRWLVTIVALAGCGSPAGPVGSAETAAALDDGGAIVLWRDAGKGADRIVRVDASGKRVWDRAIDGLPRLTPPIVDGDQVLVRHHHVARYGVGSQAIAAFALEDGTPRWDTDLDDYVDARGPNGTPIAPAYLDVTLVGDRIVAWVGDEHGLHLGAAILDHAGKLEHRAAASDGEPGAPVVVGTRVITHAGGLRQIVDAAGGASARFEGDGRGCAFGDDYVFVEGDALVARRGGDPSARRTLAQPFHPVGAADGQQILVTCGRHGDALVLAILVAEGAYVVVADAAGAVRRVIDLEEDGFSIDEDAERYALGPLQGELPRFVPYVADPSGENPHLRVLDLEDGKIAWEGPNDLFATMQTLFRADDDWYLSLDGAITRIDGGTGEPAASMVADHDDGIGALRPHAIGGGRVWLTAPFKGPIDQLAITALDGKTLAPVVTRRIEVADLSQEARDVYGRE